MCCNQLLRGVQASQPNPIPDKTFYPTLNIQKTTPLPKNNKQTKPTILPFRVAHTSIQNIISKRITSDTTLLLFYRKYWIIIHLFFIRRGIDPHLVLRSSSRTLSYGRVILNKLKVFDFTPCYYILQFWSWFHNIVDIIHKKMCRSSRAAWTKPRYSLIKVIHCIEYGYRFILWPLVSYHCGITKIMFTKHDEITVLSIAILHVY